MKGLKGKVGMGLVVGLALCVMGASSAWALGLSLTGDANWTLANISPESINESTTTWTVTNTDGTVAEDISISVADSTNWQPASASDVDKFVLDHNAYSPGTPWKNVTNSGVSLKDNLEASGTKNFKLQFTAPKSGSVASQTITVTLTANNQWYSGPILSDIDTHYGLINTAQQVVITGTGFEDPARVRLNKTGETSIVDETPTYTSGTSLTAEFNLTGANEGIYTIEVENTSTGDKSPAKTASDGDDCFFGVAAPDSDEWTNDPCLIPNGLKVGNSSLKTLTGHRGTPHCNPCPGSGTIGTLTWSSCEILTDEDAGGKKYYRFTNPRVSNGYIRNIYGANFCTCINEYLTLRGKVDSPGQSTAIYSISTACEAEGTSGERHWLDVIDCW